MGIATKQERASGSSTSQVGMGPWVGMGPCVGMGLWVGMGPWVG